jgi:anion-transporting  ArsA/GET3 family ATPase
MERRPGQLYANDFRTLRSFAYYFKVPLLKSEVTGIQALEEIGQHLCGEDDPARIYFTGNTMI